MKAVTRSTIVLLAVVFTTRLAAAEENRPEADPSLAIELSNVAANATLPDEPPRGSLVIIGGALRYSPNDVWDRIIELAGGKGAKIAVFPTASSDPLANGSLTVEALKQAGAEPFLVPVRVTSGELDYRQAVADTKLVEQVRAAGGVYFIGGSQERITQALGSTAGDSTPMLSAIWEVYRRGGVIAGTSARR